MSNRTKLAHLHLSDYNNNKYTLICNLVNDSISYVFYSGWNSSGTPNSLSNLQCNLPLYPYGGETTDSFVSRLVNVINNESVKQVVELIPVKIKFEKS
jgi:isocitrate lyase